MCKCIKKLTREEYVSTNLLQETYFLRSDKTKKSPYLQIKFCPVCGDKLPEATDSGKKL